MEATHILEIEFDNVIISEEDLNVLGDKAECDISSQLLNIGWYSIA